MILGLKSMAYQNGKGLSGEKTMGELSNYLGLARCTRVHMNEVVKHLTQGQLDAYMQRGGNDDEN